MLTTSKPSPSWSGCTVAAAVLVASAMATGCASDTSASPTSPTPNTSPQAALRTFVHDCLGVLATVDVTTGSLTVVGNTGVSLTDIAANAQGELFGMTFEDLYAISASNAQVRRIGAHQILGGNALAFGPDGALYAAGGFSTMLYRVDPSSGRATPQLDMRSASGGDLAFAGGVLYLASLTNALVRISLGGQGSGVVVGTFSLPGVLGLTGTTDGRLYAVAGNQIARINTATAATISAATFSGTALSGACGQSPLR